MTSSLGSASSSRLQPAGLLQVLDQARVHAEHRRGLAGCQADRLCLAVVVAQDEAGDVVGHLGEQLVALLLGHVAVRDHAAEEDLDVDLVVGAVDAGRVVDGVRVDPPAGQRVLDAGALREAEVAALADHARADVLAVHAQPVVGLVADLEVRLGRGLDERPDPAVPEQVDLRREDRADELVRRQRLRLDAEAPPDLGRERDRLGRPREDAAACRDDLGVVVGPARAREVEQALALLEARLRLRVGVEEDVLVVERGHQLEVAREQHAVAEDVAGHVADPDRRDLGGLHVDAELAEVALDRLPGAAGRDAHRLVVVAG